MWGEALGSSLSALPHPSVRTSTSPAEKRQPSQRAPVTESRFHTQGLPRLSRRDCITCLLIPTGKLEPLVARLMGATTATRVGDGADCLFFGGNAGGGLKQIKKSHETKQPKQNSLNSYQGRAPFTIRHFTPTFHTFNSRPTPLLPKQTYQTCQNTTTRKPLPVPSVRTWHLRRLRSAEDEREARARTGLARPPDGPSEEGRTSMASKKQGAGLHILTLMALSSFQLILPIHSSNSTINRGGC